MHCFEDALYYESSDSKSSGEDYGSLFSEKSKSIVNQPVDDIAKNKFPESKSAPLFKTFEKELPSTSNSLRTNFELKLSQSSHNLFENPRMSNQDNSICKTLTPVMNRKNKRISFLNCNKENTTSQELSSNSSRSSPRINRKSIDITSSKEYRDIYASNVRLYSVVIAKQMATLGQVGREMDDLRKSKIKKKALLGKDNFNENKIQCKSKINYSNLGGILNLQSTTISDNTFSTNMWSLNETSINNVKNMKSKVNLNDISVSKENFSNITNDIPENQTSINDFGSNITKELQQQTQQHYHHQQQHQQQRQQHSSNTNLENNHHNCGSSNHESMSSTTNGGISRFKSAADRTECLRKCLESFDSTVLMANTFLAKVKTQTAPDVIKH